MEVGIPRSGAVDQGRLLNLFGQAAEELIEDIDIQTGAQAAAKQRQDHRGPRGFQKVDRVRANPEIAEGHVQRELNGVQRDNDHDHHAPEEQFLERELVACKPVPDHGADEELDQGDAQDIEQGFAQDREVIQILDRHRVAFQRRIDRDGKHHGVDGILTGEKRIGNNADHGGQDDIADADNDHESEDAQERVLDAVLALKAGDLKKLGSLLNESHASLKNDYEVTGLELDTLAETSQKQPGCLGARMTGAGFGGCAIALVHKDNVDGFIENVQKEYTARVGYSAGFFVCSSGDGVSRFL